MANSQWSGGRSPAGFCPIEDYLVIGDLRSAALIAPDGSMDWLCLPQFDSPSIFGRILDNERGGAFLIEPSDPFSVDRQYRPQTNIVESRFRTKTGEWLLMDWMTPPPGPTQVNRRIIVLQGEARVRVSIDLRPEYGENPGPPSVLETLHWMWSHGGREWHVLSDFELTVTGSMLTADLVLPAGTEGGWALGPGLKDWSTWHNNQIIDESETAQYWRQWCACAPDTSQPFAQELERSALALKLMTYAPTGAIVAAPTTSLPEDPGGSRNWDYRFTWLRDASMTIVALQRLGHAEEGRAFFRWMITCCAVNQFVLHPVVPGHPVHEWEHPFWHGYEGARPVRIGNAASSQRQLDVYGEVLEAAWQHFRYDDTEVELLWPFLRQLVDEAAARWLEPDEGIWETRGLPQHFTYSKAQCWVALDRGIRLARRWDLDAPISRWQATANTIQQAVLNEGYQARTGSFMQSFGGSTWDASVLLLPQLGIIAPDDPRVASTVDAVRRHLGVLGDEDEVFLYRYRGMDDGVPGSEHAFLLCSTWLIGTLALMGRVGEATRLLHRLVSISPHGLYAEEYDPVTGRFWGNFPQAFTHLGIIMAIFHVQQAEASNDDSGPLTGCRGWAVR